MGEMRRGVEEVFVSLAGVDMRVATPGPQNLLGSAGRTGNYQLSCPGVVPGRWMPRLGLIVELVCNAWGEPLRVCERKHLLIECQGGGRSCPGLRILWDWEGALVQVQAVR